MCIILEKIINKRLKTELVRGPAVAGNGDLGEINITILALIFKKVFGITWLTAKSYL